MAAHLRRASRYNHFPYWDGVNCIVGMPAAFKGDCKYSPDASLAVPASFKRVLNKIGLLECSTGAQCLCTGCEELNNKLTFGPTAPEDWVEKVHEPDALHSEYRAIKRKVEVYRKQLGQIQGDGEKSMKRREAIYQRRIASTVEHMDERMRRWTKADTERKTGRGVPRFDNSGLHIEGRFQFRTTCMHRRKGGPDCACYLVDTSISEHTRSSCSKARGRRMTPPHARTRAARAANRPASSRPLKPPAGQVAHRCAEHGVRDRRAESHLPHRCRGRPA